MKLTRALILLLCFASCYPRPVPPKTPVAFSLPASLPQQPASLSGSQPASAPVVAASAPGSQPTSAALSLTQPALLALREEASSFWSEASRSRFAYQASRKFTVGFLGGLNSEVLFANVPLQEGAVTSLLLYAPSFILMDELVQRYNMGATSTFYLGALYGLWLEGLMIGTIPESPGFFVSYVTTFWHGLITTYCAFEETESLFPRRKPGKFNRGWVIGGSIFAGAATLVFFPFLAAPNYAANPITGPAAIVGAGGLFTYLLHRRVSSGAHEYKPTPWMAVSLIATGFALGFVHQAIAKKELEEDPEAEVAIYSGVDHAIRSGAYFTIEAGMLVRAIKLTRKK